MIDRGRQRGCLLGLAAGDALGTTVEFRERGTFEPLTRIIGGGPFRLRPGEWTDDTSMALCLAASLAECGGFDAADQMARYWRWRAEGYMSSNGRCFDIGNTVRDALARYRESGDPIAGPTCPMSAGNGCIMRLAPVAIFFAADEPAARHSRGRRATRRRSSTPRTSATTRTRPRPSAARSPGRSTASAESPRTG